MSNRRVWDTFLFNDELDLLEARLIELDSAVYRHVLVEAPVTFQGGPKPLHFLENQERFAPWKDKIIHVTADLEDCRECWEREKVAREAILQGLGGGFGTKIFFCSAMLMRSLGLTSCRGLPATRWQYGVTFSR